MLLSLILTILVMLSTIPSELVVIVLIFASSSMETAYSVFVFVPFMRLVLAFLTFISCMMVVIGAASFLVLRRPPFFVYNLSLRLRLLLRLLVLLFTAIYHCSVLSTLNWFSTLDELRPFMSILKHVISEFLLFFMLLLLFL